MTINVGDICDGVVIRAENYGLVVEIDGVPGLLRVPDLSSNAIKHPTDVANIGDRVRFQVLQVKDPKTSPNEQFNGSIRALSPNDS